MASDIIRAATPADAEALCRLNREFNGDDTAPAEKIRSSLQSSSPERCLVYCKDGEVVGFVCSICFDSMCYNDPVGQITELFVQSEFRRTGAGEALLRGMVALLKAEGAREISLLTGSDNLAAQSLYEKCGFSAEDERFYQLEIP